MKMNAAVLHDVNIPLIVEEIDLADPKPGEVRVKIEAVGLCQADIHYMKGVMGCPTPIVLGHEGAGIVDAVGEGVWTVKPGDHVLMGVLVPCGKCPECVAGKPYQCEVSPERRRQGGQLSDGTSRLSKDGKSIACAFAQGSFAEYVVVWELSVAKIDEKAPFDKICSLGCGVGTGLGAAFNNPKLKIEFGDSVAVFGCGTVGMSVIMGAKLAHARKIIAVDILDDKLAVARELGATMTVNAKKEDPIERIVLDTGGVDYAFECVGIPALVNQAYDVAKAVGGTVVVCGAMAMGQTVTFDGFPFLLGKSVVGVGAGFMKSGYDLPRYVDLYMRGELPMDKLVTHHFKLEDINQAVEVLEKGECIKAVIHP
ncbi:alcohol dehydrogenase catalytic domain-containing protein [Chloroflexota bacterium]